MNEFSFSESCRSRPGILLKMNSFTGIFPRIRPKNSEHHTLFYKNKVCKENNKAQKKILLFHHLPCGLGLQVPLNY